MAILFIQEDRSRIQNAWLSNALCFVWYFSRTVDTPFQRGYYLQRRAKCPIYIWWGSYMVHVFNITCLLTVQFYVQFIIIFSLFGVTLIFKSVVRLVLFQNDINDKHQCYLHGSLSEECFDMRIDLIIFIWLYYIRSRIVMISCTIVHLCHCTSSRYSRFQLNTEN